MTEVFYLIHKKLDLEMLPIINFDDLDQQMVLELLEETRRRVAANFNRYVCYAMETAGIDLADTHFQQNMSHYGEILSTSAEMQERISSLITNAILASFAGSGITPDTNELEAMGVQGVMAWSIIKVDPEWFVRLLRYVRANNMSSIFIEGELTTAARLYGLDELSKFRNDWLTALIAFTKENIENAKA